LSGLITVTNQCAYCTVVVINLSGNTYYYYMRIVQSWLSTDEAQVYNIHAYNNIIHGILIIYYYCMYIPTWYMRACESFSFDRTVVYKNFGKGFLPQLAGLFFPPKPPGRKILLWYYGDTYCNMILLCIQNNIILKYVTRFDGFVRTNLSF